jgi:hypothetical protein
MAVEEQKQPLQKIGALMVSNEKCNEEIYPIFLSKDKNQVIDCRGNKYTISFQHDKQVLVLTFKTVTDNQDAVRNLLEENVDREMYQRWDDIKYQTKLLKGQIKILQMQQSSQDQITEVMVDIERSSGIIRKHKDELSKLATSSANKILNCKKTTTTTTIKLKQGIQYQMLNGDVLTWFRFNGNINENPTTHDTKVEEYDSCQRLCVNYGEIADIIAGDDGDYSDDDDDNGGDDE